MWTRYLLVVVCVSPSIPVLQARLRFPSPKLRRFSQRTCIPSVVGATCQMQQDPGAPFTVTGTVGMTQINANETCSVKIAWKRVRYGPASNAISAATSIYCGRYGRLNVKINLKGFPRSYRIRWRGFHVHEFGDLSDGCASAGGHYNPLNVTHGAPTDKVRHVGDFGNVPIRKDGTVVYRHRDKKANLEGRHSILGRAIVVHEGTDDLGQGGTPDSKTTGNAGSRLACCVIGRKQTS